MKTLWGLLCLAALAAPAAAQERHLFTSDEALTVEDCERFIAQAIPRIESFTRMKFRRKIPVRIMPRATWLQLVKAKGFAGMVGRSGLAFYSPGNNSVTISPWTMGYDWRTGKPRRKLTKDEWLMRLEPILIHEITHALHHQNFITRANVRQQSNRKGGLDAEQLDAAVVDFILSEGVAELVPLRTSLDPSKMSRHPARELSHGRRYMRRYVQDDRTPFLIKLSATGYQDGMDLLHHFSLMKGPRGIRAVLYRKPPRELLFQPKILAAIQLDDPPEPDFIFWFLYPTPSMEGVDIRLAVDPGEDRFFRGADGIHGTNQKGCLLGYYTDIGIEDSAQGRFRYAFFVADPDHPGDWSQEQVASLRKQGVVSEKQVALPLSKPEATAKLITVKTSTGGRFLRAESEGLVILAHETKPTPNLEERVIKALRALYIRRPTRDLYGAGLVKARAALQDTDD